MWILFNFGTILIVAFFFLFFFNKNIPSMIYREADAEVMFMNEEYSSGIRIVSVEV